MSRYNILPLDPDNAPDRRRRQRSGSPTPPITRFSLTQAELDARLRQKPRSAPLSGPSDRPGYGTDR
jgi:hypothetical protein